MGLQLVGRWDSLNKFCDAAERIYGQKAVIAGIKNCNDPDWKRLKPRYFPCESDLRTPREDWALNTFDNQVIFPDLARILESAIKAQSAAAQSGAKPGKASQKAKDSARQPLMGRAQRMKDSAAHGLSTIDDLMEGTRKVKTQNIFLCCFCFNQNGKY